MASRRPTRRRNRQQALARNFEAVHSVTAEITRELDLGALLALVHERAIALTHATGGVLYLWDETRQRLVPRVSAGVPAVVASLSVALGEGISGTTAAARRGMRVNDYVGSPYAHPRVVAEMAVVAVLTEPLLYRDALLGVILVASEAPGHAFGAEDQTLLAVLAAHAAIAVENATLYRDAQHELSQRRETETQLRQLARAVEQSPASVVITDPSGAIEYVNPKFSAVTGYGAEEVVGRNPRILKSGATSAEDYAALWESITAGREWRGEFHNRRKDGTHYWEFASISPIRDGEGQITHFVAVKEDITRRKTAELALAERARHLEAVRLISAEISRELELGTLLELILERAMPLVGAVSGTVFLWDADAQTLVPAVWRGFGPWRRDIRLHLGEGVAGQIAARRTGLIVNDYRSSPFAHGPALERTAITAVLGEPLLCGEELFGVVTLNNEGTGRPFADEDSAALALLASQAAIAIRNARLHEEVRGSLRDREALLGNVRRSEEQLHAILSALAEHIAVLDGEGRIVAVNRAWERFAGENGIAHPSQVGVGVNYLGVVQRAIEGGDDSAREALAGIESVLRGDRPAFQLEYPCHSPATQRWFLLSATPLPAGRPGAVVAHLDITARRAMEEVVAERARQLTTLNDLSRTLSAKLEPREVCQCILAAAQVLIPGSVGRLWELGEDGESLSLLGGVGLADSAGGQTFKFQEGRGLLGVAARLRQPVTSLDVTRDPRFPDADWARAEGLASAYVCPLLLGERTTGFLSLYTRTRHAFSGDEQDLLGLFAAQAAIAHRNARLHEVALRRAQLLEQLTGVSQRLGGVLSPERAANEIMGAIGVLFSGSACQLWVWDPDAGRLRLTATLGLPEPGPGAQRELRRGEGLAGTAAATGQITVSPNVQQDSRFVNREWAVEVGLVTAMAFPLTTRERLLGALVVLRRDAQAYGADEAELLRSLAAHAAIAIESAHLHAAVRGQAEQLEARVRERTREVEKALRVKGEFLARMSHELRTPLNFITGFVDLLGQASTGPLTQKQRQFVDRIRTGATHLLGLVENLLDLSQLEVAKTTLHLQKVVLPALLQDVLGLFSGQAAQKGVRLESRVEPGLSAVADARRLVQILANLVGNGVKFTPTGGAVVVTARTNASIQSETQARGATAAASSGVEIAVQDTGVGIAPEDLERIFLGFEQADNSPTRQHGGAGIGLALVRALVSGHGGRVWAESDGPGKGARFIIHLPPLAPAAAPRILVVDDDPVTLKTVCIFLRDAGYVVDGVETGRDASARLITQPPDAVVLDVGLPDRSGWDLLREIRSTSGIHDIPVLVMTGREDGADTAKNLGANEFLTKPVSASVLTQVVRDLLAATPHADLP